MMGEKKRKLVLELYVWRLMHNVQLSGEIVPRHLRNCTAYRGKKGTGRRKSYYIIPVNRKTAESKEKQQCKNKNDAAINTDLQKTSQWHNCPDKTIDLT
jgi:hypothetical protein